jgi:hypothetical protein
MELRELVLLREASAGRPAGLCVGLAAHSSTRVANSRSNFSINAEGAISSDSARIVARASTSEYFAGRICGSIQMIIAKLLILMTMPARELQYFKDKPTKDR